MNSKDSFMKNVSIQLSRHDQFQLEAKIIYPLVPGQKSCDYSVDMFFFLPRNLAVNAASYTHREFYNDFSEYIRFKTPSMRLADLIKPGNSVMQKLSRAATRLPASKDEFERCLKMFCSIARSSLRDDAQKIKQSPPDERNHLLTAYLNSIEKLLALFRAYRNAAGDTETYLLVDEYLSIMAGNYLYELWEFFVQNGCSGCSEENKQKIIHLTHSETEYRRACKYPSVPDENSDNAELLYRESVLKKAMASILFLNVDTRKDGVWIENLFMSLAAAVAMIFVTAVAFIWQGLYLEEFSLSFFIVWVIAYMFKDRIKFILQNYCLSKRSRYSYDYRQKVFDGLGNKVGTFHEGFRFCDAGDIDEKITEVRNPTALSLLENGSLKENVLVYRKKIELSGDACKNIFQEFQVDGVVNIYRLNIRHWLNKMDNPQRIIYNSDGKTIRPLKARRDYHVNLIIKVSKKGCQDKFVRCRLVLCRSGIRFFSR